MSNIPKLELTWIGKENRPKLEPRILLEDPEKSYLATSRVTDHDLFDNRLIFGDNPTPTIVLAQSVYRSPDTPNVSFKMNCPLINKNAIGVYVGNEDETTQKGA